MQEEIRCPYCELKKMAEGMEKMFEEEFGKGGKTNEKMYKL